jgi:uncharacterized protein (DUF433 family)
MRATIMIEDLITSDPDILNGKPIIKGTRIPVALILQCLASGMTREEVLRGYPTLTEEGFHAALDYAARQFQGEEVHLFEGHAP